MVLVLLSRPQFAEPRRAHCSGGEVPPLDGHTDSASCRCAHGDAAWRRWRSRGKEFAGREMLRAWRTRRHGAIALAFTSLLGTACDTARRRST